MRHTTSILFGLSLLASGVAQAGVNTFLCSPQLPGESLQVIAPGCIEIISASEAAFMEGTAVETRDMRFAKYADSSSQPLRRMLALGTRIPQATFAQFKQTGQQNGQPQLYTHVKLFDVSVTSLASELTEEGAGLETVSFSSSKVEYMYRKQNSDGTLAQATYQCWDRARRTVAASQCP